MTADYFMPSEVARLVLGYLHEVSCPRAYKTFREECDDLKEHNRVAARRGVDSTKVNGQSLLDVLDAYTDLVNKPALSGVKKTMKVMIDHVDGSPCQPKITITPVTHDTQPSFRHQESQSVHSYKCHRRTSSEIMTGSRPEFHRRRHTSHIPVADGQFSGLCHQRTTGDSPDKRLDQPTPVAQKKRSNVTHASVASDSGPSQVPQSGGHLLSNSSEQQRHNLPLPDMTYADVRTPFSVPLMSPRTPAEMFSPAGPGPPTREVEAQDNFEADVFGGAIHSPESRTPRLMISSSPCGGDDTSREMSDRIEGRQWSGIGIQHASQSAAGPSEDQNRRSMESNMTENLPQTPSKESCNLSIDSALLRTPRRKRPPKRKGGSAASSNNNSNESQKTVNTAALEQEVEQLLNNLEFAEKLAENINLVKNKPGESEKEAAETGKTIEEQVTETNKKSSAASAHESSSGFSLDPAELHNIDTNFPFQSRQEAKKLADDALRDIIDMTRNDPEFDALFNIFHTDGADDKAKAGSSSETQDTGGTHCDSSAIQTNASCGLNAASEDGRSGPGVTVVSTTQNNLSTVQFLSIPNTVAMTCSQPSSQNNLVLQPPTMSNIVTMTSSQLTVREAGSVNSPMAGPSVSQNQQLPVLYDMPLICEKSSSNETSDSDRYPLVHAVALPRGSSVVDLPVSVNDSTPGQQQLVQVVHPAPAQTSVQTVQILSIDPPKRRTSNGLNSGSSINCSSARPISNNGIITTSCTSRNAPVISALSDNTYPANVTILPQLASMPNLVIPVEKNNNQTCILKLPDSSSNIISSSQVSNFAHESPCVSPLVRKTSPVRKKRRRPPISDLPRRVTRSAARRSTDNVKEAKPDKPAEDDLPEKPPPLESCMSYSPRIKYQPLLPRLAPKPPMVDPSILLNMQMIFEGAAASSNVNGLSQNVPIIIQAPALNQQGGSQAAALSTMTPVTSVAQPDASLAGQATEILQETPVVLQQAPSNTQSPGPPAPQVITVLQQPEFSQQNALEHSAVVSQPSAIVSQHSAIALQPSAIVSPTEPQQNVQSINSISANQMDVDVPFSTIDTRDLTDCVDITGMAGSKSTKAKAKKDTNKDLHKSSKRRRSGSKKKKSKEKLKETLVAEAESVIQIQEPETDRQQDLLTETELATICIAEGIAIEESHSRSNGDSVHDRLASSPSPTAALSVSSQKTNLSSKNVQSRIDSHGQLQNDESIQYVQSNSLNGVQSSVQSSEHSLDIPDAPPIVITDSEELDGNSQSTHSSSCQIILQSELSLKSKRPISNRVGELNSCSGTPSPPLDGSLIKEINTVCLGTAQAEKSSNDRLEKRGDPVHCPISSADSNSCYKVSPASVSNQNEVAPSPISVAGVTNVEKDVLSRGSPCVSEHEASRHSVNDSTLGDSAINKTVVEASVAPVVSAAIYSPVSVCSPAPNTNDHSRDSTKESLSVSGQKKMPRRIRPTLLTREISSSMPSSPSDYTGAVTALSLQEKSVTRKGQKSETPVVECVEKEITSKKSPSKVKSQSKSPVVVNKTNSPHKRRTPLKSPGRKRVQLQTPKKDIPLKDQLALSDDSIKPEDDEKSSEQNNGVQEEQQSNVVAKSPAVRSCQNGGKETSRSPWHEGLSSGSPWQFQQPDSSLSNIKSPEPKKPEPKQPDSGLSSIKSPEPQKCQPEKTFENRLKVDKVTVAKPETQSSSHKPKVAEKVKLKVIKSAENLTKSISETHPHRKIKRVKMVNGERHRVRTSSKDTAAGEVRQVKLKTKVNKPNCLFDLGALAQAASLQLKQASDGTSSEKPVLKRKLAATPSKHKRQSSGSPSKKKQKLEKRPAASSTSSTKNLSENKSSSVSSHSQDSQAAFSQVDIDALIAQMHSSIK